MMHFHWWRCGSRLFRCVLKITIHPFTHDCKLQPSRPNHHHGRVITHTPVGFAHQNKLKRSAPRAFVSVAMRSTSLVTLAKSTTFSFLRFKMQRQQQNSILTNLLTWMTNRWFRCTPSRDHSAIPLSRLMVMSVIANCIFSWIHVVLVIFWTLPWLLD